MSNHETVGNPFVIRKNKVPIRRAVLNIPRKTLVFLPFITTGKVSLPIMRSPSMSLKSSDTFFKKVRINIKLIIYKCFIPIPILFLSNGSKPHNTVSAADMNISLDTGMSFNVLRVKKRGRIFLSYINPAIYPAIRIKNIM